MHGCVATKEIRMMTPMIERKLDWKAAIWAGIIAGVVFMMLEMLLVMWLKGQSPWGPPRMIAAMVMGKGVLPPPAPFDMGVLLVAMMVHFVVAIVLAFIFAWLASAIGAGMVWSIIGGAVFGVMVYFVNFYGATALFPWFAMARGPITLFTHAMFGLVLGCAYWVIARSGTTRGSSRSVM